MAFSLLALAKVGFGLAKGKAGKWLVDKVKKGAKLVTGDSKKWMNKNFKLSGPGADQLGMNNTSLTQPTGSPAMDSGNLLKIAAAAAAAFTLFK